jgi:integrase
MASVHRRVRGGKITYQATWKEAGVGGAKRQCGKSFARATDAKAYAARMEQEVERRHIGDPERHTVEKFLARWLATLRDRGGYSPSTLSGYKKAVALAVREIGELSLSRLTAQHLDDGYARMRKRGGRVKGKPNVTRPLTVKSVKQVHRVLHAAFEQARRWKLVGENPASDATAPSPSKSARSKARAFTLDEVNRLMQAASADPETHVIVCTLLAGGLRRAELLGLAFDAIDFDKAMLTIKRTVIEGENGEPVMCDHAKTETSMRALTIPPVLIVLLREQRARVNEMVLQWGREYRREPLLVFPGLAGTPMRPEPSPTGCGA